MLVVSPLRSSNTDGSSKGGPMEANFDDFPDFTSGNLLDSIDFDDLFMVMHHGDVLPDLEMDPELLAEFSLSTTNTGGDNDSSSAMSVDNNTCDDANLALFDAHHHQLNTTPTLHKEDYIKKDECQTDVKLDSTNSSSKEGEKGKKSSSYSKNNNCNNNNNNQAKRKTKVDWTPELHRRFVQAVEQLGVDKAVPSRILELMGIDCLTRHNIASHLQKYRSHRKHLLAREAEAANWTQKRQMYGVAMGGGKGGGNISPWYPPTMGFPPVTANMHHHHPFRPLHVWGHPTMDPQARLPMWPKQVTPLPPAWAAPPPTPPDPSFWHSPHHRRVGVAAVPGIPPHIMFRPDQHVLPLQSGSHPPFDLHPSKESIDAAIGDVLAKPWQPLPIGLKPPSMDSVMVELQRQGIPKIPPSCA